MQASENSNKGRSSCVSLTVDKFSVARLVSGRFKKKAQFCASVLRSGSCSRRLIAFNLTSLLFLAGQISTQIPQPVQSSGATCRVYFKSLNSFQRAGELLNVSGAFASSFSSYTLARITGGGKPEHICRTEYINQHPR